LNISTREGVVKFLGSYMSVASGFRPSTSDNLNELFSQRNPTTVIVMELGGMNFDNYFSTKILEGQDYNIKKHEHILSKMILCAARALQQFHKR